MDYVAPEVGRVPKRCTQVRAALLQQLQHTVFLLKYSKSKKLPSKKLPKSELKEVYKKATECRINDHNMISNFTMMSSDWQKTKVICKFWYFKN